MSVGKRGSLVLPTASQVSLNGPLNFFFDPNPGEEREDGF
jgi:hypothetical protein